MQTGKQCAHTYTTGYRRVMKRKSKTDMKQVSTSIACEERTYRRFEQSGKVVGKSMFTARSPVITLHDIITQFVVDRLSTAQHQCHADQSVIERTCICKPARNSSNKRQESRQHPELTPRKPGDGRPFEKSELTMTFVLFDSPRYRECPGTQSVINMWTMYSPDYTAAMVMRSSTCLLSCHQEYMHRACDVPPSRGIHMLGTGRTNGRPKGCTAIPKFSRSKTAGG